MPPAHAAFYGREKPTADLKASWDVAQVKGPDPPPWGTVDQPPNFNHEINRSQLNPELAAAVTHPRLAAGCLNVFTKAIRSESLQLLYSSLTILSSPGPCVMIRASPSCDQSFLPLLGFPAGNAACWGTLLGQRGADFLVWG